MNVEPTRASAAAGTEPSERAAPAPLPTDPAVRAPVPPSGTAPPAPPRSAPPTGRPVRPPAVRYAPPPTRRHRGRRILAATAIAILLLGMLVVVGTYYVDSVPTPEQLQVPESTTIYYADGRTPMAKLGVENRTLLKYEEMND